MKKRIVSAIIMIAVFIPFLILGGNFYLVLGSVLGVLSLWELMRLEKNIPAYRQYQNRNRQKALYFQQVLMLFPVRTRPLLWRLI